MGLWRHPGGGIRRAAEHGFDGLEANLQHPALTALEAGSISDQLQAAGQRLILELVTGGDYVPALQAGPEQHLAELEQLLEQAQPLQPLRISVITGSDSWPMAEQHRFLERALDLATAADAPVSFETHRSRSLFNPWAIAAVVRAHPRLRLTADLSHWCCVAERLMEPELEPIQAMAERVDHIHARIGHSQGPSVSHPFAPEWDEALQAHRRCWQLFRQHQAARQAVPES